MIDYFDGNLFHDRVWFTFLRKLFHECEWQKANPAAFVIGIPTGILEEWLEFLKNSTAICSTDIFRQAIYIVIDILEKAKFKLDKNLSK